MGAPGSLGLWVAYNNATVIGLWVPAAQVVKMPYAPIGRTVLLHRITDALPVAAAARPPPNPRLVTAPAKQGPRQAVGFGKAETLSVPSSLRGVQTELRGQLREKVD